MHTASRVTAGCAGRMLMHGHTLVFTLAMKLNNALQDADDNLKMRVIEVVIDVWSHTCSSTAKADHISGLQVVRCQDCHLRVG